MSIEPRIGPRIEHGLKILLVNQVSFKNLKKKNIKQSLKNDLFAHEI